MSEPFERSIRCHDLFGRQRALRLSLSPEGEVVIQVPAGESALLDPKAVSELREALTETPVWIFHHRGGRS